MTTELNTPTTWDRAVEIANVPAVHEAIATLCEDATEDNAVCAIQAILDAALTQRPAAQTEREAFEAAMKDSWQMVDPLRPPTAGSYYAGEHAGICAALKTMRANFERHWNARASLPAPQQATSHVETDWISNVIRDVSELPDRSSPDDEPDMMLVTAAELRSILETHAPQQATPDQFADASKMVSPVALRSVRLTRDTAGMCVVRVNGRVAIRDNGDIIDHIATLEWFADTQQATPTTSGNILTDAFNEVQALKQQATPEPVPAEQAKWCEYVAGMVDCWVSAEWSNYHHKDEDRRVKAIAGIIERRLWALQKQAAATPEPVGEPHHYWLEAWSASERDRLVAIWTDGIDLAAPDDKPVYTPQWKVVMALMQDELKRLRARSAPVEAEPVGEPTAWRWFNSNGDQVTNWLDFKSAQNANVEAQVAEVGGRIEYAYTRPATGVPEGFALVPVEPTAEMMEAMPSLPAIGAPGDMELKADGWSLKAIQNRHRWLAALAAAQANGGWHG